MLLSKEVICTYAYNNQNELYHYGVKGMKWGVRRWQNRDGSLTAAGKKRERQELRDENKKAYQLGKNATIYGRAAAKSMSRTIKYENKLGRMHYKDPEGYKGSTQRQRKKWEASAKATAQLVQTYKKYESEAVAHCKSLIDKYGDEYVRSIKTKDIKLPDGKYSPSGFKTINERTNNLSDFAKAGAATLATNAALTLMGVPVIYLISPKTAGEKGRDLEQITYYQNRREQRGK